VKISLHVRYFDKTDALDRYDHFTDPLEAFEMGLELLCTDLVEGIQLSVDKDRH